jgi:hypothetical protein
VRGKKGRERVVGKAAGDELRSAGLADRVGAMPDAAGGEAVAGPLNRRG